MIDIILRVIFFALGVAAMVSMHIKNRRLHNLVHQERVTVAMACATLRNLPSNQTDRDAFVALKLADINRRAAARPK